MNIKVDFNKREVTVSGQVRVGEEIDRKHMIKEVLALLAESGCKGVYVKVTDHRVTQTRHTSNYDKYIYTLKILDPKLMIDPNTFSTNKLWASPKTKTHVRSK